MRDPPTSLPPPLVPGIMRASPKWFRALGSALTVSLFSTRCWVTLVVSTTGDPATPYEAGVRTAERLESGVLLTYDGEVSERYASSNPRDELRPQLFEQCCAWVIARGTQKFPQDAELLVGAAGVYRDAGQLQQATETLKRGLALNPRAGQANLVLAQLYADQGMPDSALTAIESEVRA